ncbi:hypothetical protein AURDEDRAFT_183781 [Auricularia subglabra TFB-10046 SS5]|nr:hypothetical protein AURDEDRAFT_183781 [Auricularia subglabra TFB-10046 SS5]
MSQSSSSSASSSNSSTWTYDTDRTSILEAYKVDEVSLDSFCKSLLNFDVTDACGRPFELNQRAVVAISALSKAKDLAASTCNVLNRIINLYDSSCRPATATTVKFVDHSRSPLLHHPEKATTARPQLIAVPNCIAASWTRDVKARSKRRANPTGPAIAWHHVLATVLVSDERQPIDQMVEFLGALNQARPDLPGCIALTAMRQACRLWWSDAAGIYVTPSLHWDDPATATYLLKFVYRLNHPLTIDATVSLEPVEQSPIPYDRRPVWLVRDHVGGVYRAEHVIAVGKPWTRKNWVVAATEYLPPDGGLFGPCSRVVIKDSFPLVDGEDYAEDAILEHLHADGRFSGVSSPISSFVVTDGAAHIRSVELPDSTVKSRRKHRLILRGDGLHLHQCPSVLRFLMAMYDALEVLRHAHERRQVLHRDISIRNIIYNESPSPQVQAVCKFAKDILAHKYPASRLPQGPACAVIDFDNAIREGHSPESAQRQTVGTPAFIARSVSREFSQGTSYVPQTFPELFGGAKDCYLHAFGREQYEANTAMYKSREVVGGPAAPERAMHGPRHDAESCFWVIVHVLTTSLPHGASRDEKNNRRAKEVIEILETNRIGDMHDARPCIFNMDPALWAKVLHPGLRSLARFMYSLSCVVQPCFELMEPPPPAYHLHEAMQRLILQELCRLLDTGELPLDVSHRRAIDSHFNDLPSAIKRHHLTTSRKRSAEGPDREDSGPRLRLSL